MGQADEKGMTEGRRRSTDRSWLSSARNRVLLGLGFQALVFALYWPVLDAPLFSDDNLYTVGNPWIVEFSFARLLEAFDPTSAPSLLVYNYSPLNLLLHAATWAGFEYWFPGHHGVNFVLHGVVALLLVLLLSRAGLPDALAVFGGLFFLLQPANVEVVSWASQLKTTASTGFAFGALLLLERRPALATLSFAAALLTKALAAFALPVALVWLYTRGDPGRARLGFDRRMACWVAVWALLLLAFAAAQMTAYVHSGARPEATHADVWVQLRSSVALAMRYLAMATTSYGVSAFHEPPPAGLSSPWWIAGCVAIAAIAARAIFTLRHRREEAAWWVWAACAFLPVSQIFPFQFAMADRYLYTMLPGLLGAVLLAVAPLYTRLEIAESTGRRIVAALGVVLLVVLGVKTWQRIPLWANPASLLVESARNYPQGMNAALVASQEALRDVRPREAVAALRLAYERGYLDVNDIAVSPGYRSLRHRRDFQALVKDMAGYWIERLESYRSQGQRELFALGNAYELRGDRSAARRAYERALEDGGMYDAALRDKLAALDARPMRER